MTEVISLEEMFMPSGPRRMLRIHEQEQSLWTCKKQYLCVPALNYAPWLLDWCVCSERSSTQLCCTVSTTTRRKHQEWKCISKFF